MIQTIVIASHNRHKAGEMIAILAPAFHQIEFRLLSDFPNAPEPDETGKTYEDNAVIKAISGARATEHWCLADDGGLEIDALPGELGPLSKRFGGEELPFSEKMDRVLEKLADIPWEARTARFRCAVAICNPANLRDIHTFNGVCEGRIAFEKRGAGGFGYDPIFFVTELGVHMAELTPEQKHAISHRGRALAQFMNWFQQSNVKS